MATISCPPRRVRALRRRRKTFWLRRLRLCPECAKRLTARPDATSRDVASR